jgi:hypothetical protein
MIKQQRQAPTRRRSAGGLTGYPLIVTGPLLRVEEETTLEVREWNRAT